jgi:nucleotide-binding universal stress UspA family protein
MGNNGMSIVVGVDGTDHAIDAARWAGAVAARSGGSLHLVHVMRPVDEALLVLASPQQADAGAYPRELGREVLDRVAEKVRADLPGLRISRTLTHRSAEDALTELSRHARVVVLACAEVSPAGALLVGSTTLTVAAHSACPVVAWRGDTVTLTAAPIVVGVDDDESAHSALVTAFGLADRLGVGVTVVHALSARRAPGEVNIPVIVDWAALENEALLKLSAAVAAVADRWPRIAVGYAVKSGRAGQVILDIAAGAQLIVVGTRGRGNVASVLLGSTGLSLLHHSSVPVVLCPASCVAEESPPPMPSLAITPTPVPVSTG